MSLLVKLKELQKRLIPLEIKSFKYEHNQEYLLKIDRHTQLIHVLRIACPAFGFLLIVFYVLKLTSTTGIFSHIPEVSVPYITTQDLAMHNPHYEGVTKDGGTYSFKAQLARQDFTNMNLIQLEEITGELTQKDKSKTYLTAVRGTYDQKANILELKEKILITTDNGMKARLKSATIKIGEGITDSKEPVQASFPAGSVESKELKMFQKEHKVSFLGNVDCNLLPSAKSGAEPKKKQISGAFVSSEDPVYITSSRLDVDDSGKTLTFIGDVRAKQSTSSLESPEMVVHYESIQQNANEEKKISADHEQKAAIARIDVKGPFLLLRGDREKITGEKALFDNKKHGADLQGNVRIISLPDKKITADRVELDQNEDSTLLTGNVTVINGKTLLRGHHLLVERKKSRSTLTSPLNSGFSSGRITAHFGGTDEDQKKPNPISTHPPSEKSAPTPKNSNQLNRLEATENVFLKTADGREVSGQWASYETKSNSLVVGGDVELKQQSSVIRGTRLLIDMETSRSTIDAAPLGDDPNSWNAISDTNPGFAKQNPKSRPSAIFFPGELKQSTEDKDFSQRTNTTSTETASTSLGNFKTNPNAPIDIEADRLDIDDQKKMAVFKGNVSVKQGQVLMISPTLKAYYTGATALADPENKD